jgi:hypothetical protein
MIYLIEDKTSRRNDYGWSDKKIEQYEDSIIVIDSIGKLLVHEETILSDDSIILYHESFANSADHEQKSKVVSFLDCINASNLRVAYFSGSKSLRTLDIMFVIYLLMSCMLIWSTLSIDIYPEIQILSI